ncbi:phage portal protein [Pseudomonas putida]|nr:phage portal protein [Pseudomonas putida]
MNLRELEAQAKALAPVLKGFVDKAVASLREALVKDIDRRDEGLRKEFGESIGKIPVLDPKEIAAEASRHIAVPENGKDADPELVRQAVAEEVAKLPPPKDGESVTLDDVRPMIVDAVKSAVEALPPTEPGVSVTAEDLRSVVAEEVAKALEAITLPKDGQPGRDALQLEILPEIVTDKSYSRGTYAKHLGGLWRSFERTSGMRGWECIVEGLSSASVEQSGERGFELSLVLSSGDEVRKSLDLPVMIYRGVFAPGDYAPGDTVTWGGSLWHCDSATSDKPGELGSKGWRLAVKRGRDGKDLAKGVSSS